MRPIGCVPLGEVQEEDEDDDEKDEETAWNVRSMMTPQKVLRKFPRLKLNALCFGQGGWDCFRLATREWS